MRNHAIQGRAITTAAMLSSAAGLFAQGAAAQSYDFQLQPEQGALNAAIEVSAPIGGTLIGNYDPDTNPDGTRTRLTPFGGGNHPVPYTATLVGDSGPGGISAQPAGQFMMDIDLIGEQVYITDLFIDALNGAAPALDATLNIIYQTFYTSNPTDFFPGGVNIPIPLGQITISSLTMTQIPGPGGEPAVGTLTPLGGNEYALNALVDVEVALEADFNGEPISPGPIQLALLLTGTLTVDGQSAHLALDISLSMNETDEGPFEPFEDIPLDIPGPFSGETVYLLVSGVIQSVTVALDLDANLIATGTGSEPPCPPIVGDLNCDGKVGVQDLLILLSMWGPCENCNNCPADIDGDCNVGVADLLILLANWG